MQLRFEVSPYTDSIKQMRAPRTIDLAKRLGIISPSQLSLRGFSLTTPVASFNPGLTIEGEEALVFPRMILGYYTYSSVIGRLALSLEEILSGIPRDRRIPVDIVLGPDNYLDRWGAEDPRIQKFGNFLAMIYVGRTQQYHMGGSYKRTLPIVAFSEDKGIAWRKTIGFTLPNPLETLMISNKDTVLLDTKKGLVILHRPNLVNMAPCLWASPTQWGINNLIRGELEELPLWENYVVMLPSRFENRLGWSTPPIELGGGEHLLLAHAESADNAYRIFALTIEVVDGVPLIKSVTPHYIMEPLEPYEKYGDRPMVVFPCGAELIDGDTLLITYGAADSFVAFASISLSELLANMKKVE